MESTAADSPPGYPEIERIVAPNPGPMTLEGTNSYLVSSPEGGVYVIDPGPADETHIAAIHRAGERRGGIVGVILTHSHLDHSEAVPSIDAPLLHGKVGSGDETAGESGAAPDTEGWTADPPPSIGPFDLLATPGHAVDHVCLILTEEGESSRRGGVPRTILFSGDLILGRGSSFVPPDGGSLAAYMDSLRRLQGLELELMIPGHGPYIADPAAKVAEYLEHRLERERLLREALAEGERSRAQLLARAWHDVADNLRPAAAVVMQAHLEKLEADGELDELELTD